MTIDEMIDKVVDGESAHDVIDEVRKKGTALRPRVRRFSGRSGVNPITGKRMDPKRRRVMRMAARKGRAKRKAAAKRFAKTAKGKMLHKKLGQKKFVR